MLLATASYKKDINFANFKYIISFVTNQNITYKGSNDTAKKKEIRTRFSLPGSIMQMCNQRRQHYKNDYFRQIFGSSKFCKFYELKLATLYSTHREVENPITYEREIAIRS